MDAGRDRMVRRDVGLVRISLGLLTGGILWLLFQALTISNPEEELVRMRYFVSQALLAATQPPHSPNDYTIIGSWRGMLPLAVLFGVLFSILKPLPRFVVWVSAMVLGAIVGIYCFHVFRYIVPLGGPAILLCACYLCGTLVHLETEKIERNRSLALDLQMQSEEERKRIAKDLHDESLPSLSRIIRLADQLHEQYKDDPIPVEIREKLESSIAEMRRVINDLHPATLEQFGLASAIEHLTSDFARESGIKISLRDSVARMELSKFQELCIFRIVQEALNNVEKHAGASEVEVALEKQDAFILVRVVDNGNGSIRQKPGSYGLQNIAHRAGLIGASVDWTAPAKYASGTMLILRLPIAGQTEPLQQPQQLQQRDA